MTEKHALDRTTKRSSMCDSRQVSVEWWVGWKSDFSRSKTELEVWK